MPTKSKPSLAHTQQPRTPQLRLHKPSGKAVVTLSNHDYYCGPFGTVAAHAEYDRLISIWLANGRRMPTANDDMRIAELIDRYLDFAEGYYPCGEGNGEIEPINRALTPLGEMFGKERANDFGPLKLKALRQRWIGEGRVRKQINAAVHRVVRCFKWGVESELVRGEVFHALRAVSGLRFGRSEAKESEPILPIGEADVIAVLPFLTVPVRAMVELQLHSGMRPGEVVQMTPATIDRRNPDVWEFRPARHKTQHHGRKRVIYLGPKCRAILTPFLNGRPDDTPLFSPAEAMDVHYRERAASRTTPMNQGNHAGKRPKGRRPRVHKDQYRVEAYTRAIARACTGAKVDRWSPNRLRHTFATKARREHGLEVAQILLGHARADVTQIYAERDSKKAAAIAAQIG